MPKKKTTKSSRQAKTETVEVSASMRTATEVLKNPPKLITNEPEVNITPEMYKAWIEQFANTITETLMAEIVKIKSAGKKKKIDV